MKNRMGFVSNSSTCSFQVYGVFFDDAQELLLKLAENGIVEDLKGLLLNVAKEYDLIEPCKRDGIDLEQTDFAGILEQVIEEIGVSELLYALDEKNGNLIPGLSLLSYDDYYGSVYIGRDFSLGEDETPRQFKAKVKEALARAFGGEYDEEQVKFHEGTYSC